MEFKIEEWIKEWNLNSDINSSNIPEMDLYMEQLTEFIDKSLEPLKREEGDKVLTKMMINSYTKDGLIMPPKNKKKYTRQHIILLILIYHLKQVLSIKDIKVLLDPILKDITTDEDDLLSIEDIYDIFLKGKNVELDKLSHLYEEKLDFIKEEVEKLNVSKGESDTVNLFLTVLTLIAQAEANKRLAEKIIDEYFVKKED